MGNTSDILIAAAMGGASGFFKNQIKENDEEKVQLETERKEKLLLEKEKRVAAVDEYKALRDRGWKVEDNATKRSEELADQDTKLVMDAAGKATERQFKSGETGLEIASREKIAQMNLDASMNKEGRSERKILDKEGRTEQRQFSKDQKAAVSDLRKEYIKARKDDPALETTFENWSQQNLPELYEIAYPNKVSAEKSDPFDVVANNISFKKKGPNQDDNQTVIQPRPLPGTMKSH